LQAARDLRFEEAAAMRDILHVLQRQGVAASVDDLNFDV
jgi:excinuclease UvrABC helicase subunit UvrB